jgi:maltodextrin utilization protein YvdJ
MSDEEQDVVIYDSSLTLDQLKGLWSYMEDDDEKPAVKFTKEEIEKLGNDIDDAIHNTIEDFLNHRGA